MLRSMLRLHSLLLFLACVAALTASVRPASAASSSSPDQARPEIASIASLPRSAPEQQGLSSAAIEAFVRDAQATVHDMHSLMVVRHGRVVAEGWFAPYAPRHPHMLYSLSKSFCSTAVGLAAAEGRLSLDDKVLSFFPDQAPAQPGENLKAMRVRDLLAMNSGHDQDTVGRLRETLGRRTEAPGGDWVRAFLSLPVEHAPGTHFTYNSGATYMLSAIVQKQTGQTVLDYLTPRLFEPLGIANPTWESCPRGITLGGWGLKVRTEDIAKFGLLYLNKGVWNGRRLLPESWVAEATTAHSDNSANKDPDWRQGYGFQFWRCRHGAFRGDGAYGQFCVVMPEQDAVVVMTSGAGNLQGELELVWKHLLPAMKPAPLPADSAARKQLNTLLAGLALSPVKGGPAPAAAKEVSGKTFRFAPAQAVPYLFMDKDHAISSLRLDCGDAVSTLTLTDDRGAHRIACGQGRWLDGPAPAHAGAPSAGPADELQAVSASGAWTAPDTWTARLCLRETPFSLTLQCCFDQGKMSVTFQQQPNAKKVDFVSSGVE